MHINYPYSTHEETEAQTLYDLQRSQPTYRQALPDSKVCAAPTLPSLQTLLSKSAHVLRDNFQGPLLGPHLTDPCTCAAPFDDYRLVSLTSFTASLACACSPENSTRVFAIWTVPSNPGPSIPPDFQTHNRLDVSRKLQIQWTPREFIPCEPSVSTPMDLPGPDLLASSCSKALCIIPWGERCPHSLSA